MARRNVSTNGVIVTTLLHITSSIEPSSEYNAGDYPRPREDHYDTSGMCS